MNIYEEIEKKAFIECLKTIIRANFPSNIAEQKCKELENDAHVATIITELLKLV